jgi:ABC-type polysaccharide/polyol phosphate export permease
MSQMPNYPLFALSGLIFWIYFSGSCSQLSQVFIKHAHLLKSLNVKKTLYAVSEQGAELVNFLAGIIVFIVFMYFLGLKASWNLVNIIPIIALFSVFTFSVGFILGALNVFFRDVGILWNTLNQALFFLTPIAYPISFVPQKYQFYLKLNPLYHFFVIIRNVLYEGVSPSLHSFGYCIIITLLFILIATLLYRRTQNGFISNL